MKAFAQFKSKRHKDPQNPYQKLSFFVSATKNRKSDEKSIKQNLF